MRYWDDMLTKYGFSDGDATPPDAEAAREIYVHAVNLLAERKGSSVRVAPYDRFGVHNSIIILFTPLSGLPDDLTSFIESVPDGAMAEAITEARQLDLDNYLVVEVSVDWEELKAGLAKEAQVEEV